MEMSIKEFAKQLLVAEKMYVRTSVDEKYVEKLVEMVQYTNDLTIKLCESMSVGGNKSARQVVRLNNHQMENKIDIYEKLIKAGLSKFTTAQLLEILEIVEHRAKKLELECELGIVEYKKSFVKSLEMAFERILNFIAEELVNRLYVDIMILRNNEKNAKARKCHIRINRLLKGSSPKMLELMRKNLSIEMEECGDSMALLFNIIRHEETLRNKLNGTSLS